MFSSIFLKRRKLFLSLIVLSLIVAPVVNASGGGEELVENFAITFLWIAVVLIAAKVSSLIEKVGQPSVLGELLIGVLIGNLALLGVHWFDPIKHDTIIAFLAELGVVILLFQIGLESNLKEMKEVGTRAALVAVLGVITPFALGYFLGPYFLPGLTSHAYLFLGATLTATSVGITARVFKDLGKLQSKEAQIVLGAAVIDDVLGLIILAVVSAIVTLGSAPLGMIGLIIVKAVAFLIGAVVIGQLSAPYISKFFSKIHTGVAMKFTLTICFGLVFAYLAHVIGLAPIVGAFAAGLILDSVHFRYFKDPKVVRDVRAAIEDADAKEETRIKVEAAIEPHARRQLEYMIEPLGNFFVPIFFVMTGMAVKLETLFDLSVLGVALAITVIAFVGKLVAGLIVGKGIDKKVVGFGMVPRGEVGLIFATIGRGLGVVDDKVFSVIVVVVILTTLLTPPILTLLLKKK